MRITERQLRRIVRQEILSEADQGKGLEKPGDVDTLIAKLEPAFTRFKSQVSKSMSNKAEIAQLVQAILDLLNKINPAKDLSDTGVLAAARAGAAADNANSMKENARRRRRA